MREDVGRSIGLSARKVQVCVIVPGALRRNYFGIDHVSDLVPGEKMCNRSSIIVGYIHAQPFRINDKRLGDHVVKAMPLSLGLHSMDHFPILQDQ